MAEDLDPVAPGTLRELAGEVFAGLYQAIVSQEEGVRSSDVEAIHDMRVATRRLRVALSNFAVCCNPETRRDMRARLGRLADALGDVRDLDVMLEALGKRKPALKREQQDYVRGLIRRLQARRLRRRRRLSDYLSGEDYAGFRRDFPLLLLQEAPEQSAVAAVSEA